MKYLFCVFLFICAASISLSAQNYSLAGDKSWVVLLGVYDEPLPEYYFNKEVLGPVEVEWNGYFYSYYTKELGSESAAKDVRAKAYNLGHVSAAVTNERHAEHPCVFCAAARDSACWTGRGSCSLPNYPRHDNFGAYTSDLGGLNNHGMRPDVDVRKTHNPLPGDVEGTHFYVMPTPNERAKQMIASSERKAANAVAQNRTIAEIPAENMMAMRGISKPKEEEEMVAKSFDMPVVREVKLAPTPKPVTKPAANPTPKPQMADNNPLKGSFYFAQILATSSDTEPNFEDSQYSLFKENKSGINKYVVGPFKDYNSCVEYCKAAKEKGFEGAFPVNYIDGVRVK